MRSIAEARRVVTGVPVGHDFRLHRDLPVGEAFQRGRIIVAGVGETNSICFRRDPHQLLVGPALSPDERRVDLDARAERLAVGTRRGSTVEALL